MYVHSRVVAYSMFLGSKCIPVHTHVQTYTRRGFLDFFFVFRFGGEFTLKNNLFISGAKVNNFYLLLYLFFVSR